MWRSLLAALLITTAAWADILPGWEGSNPNSSATVNHQAWQQFLDSYLRLDDFGQSYFAYHQVTSADRRLLDEYLDRLQSVNPLSLNANEQLAYWINLYNAATVQLILENYPVKSIRDIGGSFGGLLPTGPWKEPLLTVNNQTLSLDNIEHDIVRPKYQDFRIHFGFNCASMGCPNLAPTAFTGANINEELDKLTVAFVNHPRGARYQNGKVIVSKLFDWYLTDFVEKESELLPFLAQFAEPRLRAQLLGHQGRIRYEYDWSLNEVKDAS